jgi:hypothetical protein
MRETDTSFCPNLRRGYLYSPNCLEGAYSRKLISSQVRPYALGPGLYALFSELPRRGVLGSANEVNDLPVEPLGLLPEGAMAAVLEHGELRVWYLLV